MKTEQMKKLLLESLEHEKGGLEVYAAALACVVNPELKEEWTRYREETRAHVTALEQACKAVGVDPATETPGRQVVRGVGQSLVTAMKQARAGGDRAAAEIVAAECVVLAETKDHLDWELIGKCAEHLGGPQAKALQAAYAK